MAFWLQLDTSSAGALSPMGEIKSGPANLGTVYDGYAYFSMEKYTHQGKSGKCFVFRIVLEGICSGVVTNGTSVSHAARRESQGPGTPPNSPYSSRTTTEREEYGLRR